ncbi:MAG: hypothetical protein OXG71_00905, partial [Rhodospirillales bacterium]|nr:hypothetical protein [Rhodospirillales bacterium]
TLRRFHRPWQTHGHGRMMAGTGALGCLVDTSVDDVSSAIITYSPLPPRPASATAYSSPASDESASNIPTLIDFEPLKFGNAVNHIDAAIGFLDDTDSAMPDIMTIGPPANPPVAPFLARPS